MKEEIPEKFWKEYESSSMLDRQEKLKVIVDRFDELFDMKDKKLRKHALSVSLMGYFDDLIDYMSARKR